MVDRDRSVFPDNAGRAATLHESMVRLRRTTRSTSATAATEEDAPRRSTRPRRPRAKTPVSDASGDDSDPTSHAVEERRPLLRTRRSARVSSTRNVPTAQDATDELQDPLDDAQGAAAEAENEDERSVAEGADADEHSGMEEDDMVEIEGQVYRIENDGLVLDTDPAGEKKVDKNGRLLGGRTYRIATLSSPQRDTPDRLYMLSIDVARGLGYRDSAYFFRKNPLFHKIFLTPEEKEQLVNDGRLNSTLRTRNVTMVAARSVFQLMGARVVERGRLVTDDYYEAQARASGKREGAPVSQPSMQDILRAERRRESDRERERGRRRPDASTHTTVDPQGEVVTTTFGDAGHAPFDRHGHTAQRRQFLLRAQITEENWLAEYARSVRAANAELLASRRSRLVAFPRHQHEARSASLLATSAVAAAETAIATTSSSSSTTATEVRHAIDSEHLVCDTRPPWERELTPMVDARARAHARREREPPLGLYDPHTHSALLPIEAQPQAASFAKVDDIPRGVPPAARLAGVYTTETCLMAPV